MMNIAKSVLDGTFDEQYFRWCFDRAATNEAKSGVKQAGAVTDQSSQNATQEHSALTPFYRSEMNATHGFNPEQTNELLNYAGSAVGGTGASAMGEAQSEAARTRNTSGFSSALGQNARDRQQQLSNANLGVGAQDIMGAKQLNQEGAAGESGLYGADQNEMLKSMGQQNEDIGTQLQAGNSGWFQNLMNGVSTVSGAMTPFKFPGHPGGH